MTEDFATAMRDTWLGGVHPAASSACKRAKQAHRGVPAHSGGVYGFFDFVEKTIHPTPKGSVREPDSLTHPQGTPVEGTHGCHLDKTFVLIYHTNERSVDYSQEVPMVRAGYLMWFDDNPKVSVVYKIEDAIEAFVRRFKVQPNVVLVSERDKLSLVQGNKAIESPDVRVRESSYVRKNNFWVGLDDEQEEVQEEATVQKQELMEAA
jgi:hypothetical protein